MFPVIWTSELLISFYLELHAYVQIQYRQHRLMPTNMLCRFPGFRYASFEFNFEPGDYLGKTGIVCVTFCRTLLHKLDCSVARNRKCIPRSP